MPAQMIETSADWMSMEDLLRQLLNLVEITDISDFSTNEEEEDTTVLFKIELNDACYTLTRCHSPPAGVMLSPREQEVVRLVTKGLSNKAIAAVLDISYWTVSTHLRRIYNKLDVGSRAEMTAKALQERLMQN
jgi:DNA-binding NarL/FixJ family response regulator